MPDNHVQWRPLQRMPETALVVQFHAEGNRVETTNHSRVVHRLSPTPAVTPASDATGSVGLTRHHTVLRICLSRPGSARVLVGRRTFAKDPSRLTFAAHSVLVPHST